MDFAQFLDKLETGPGWFRKVCVFPMLLGLSRFLRGPHRLKRKPHRSRSSYGFSPRACVDYRAKTKGKVERPFCHIRQDFFLVRGFLDLTDMIAQRRLVLAGVAKRSIDCYIMPSLCN